ncbi:hypothetical protein GCM10020258_21440 [Sphingomonas yabuuchiae]
MERHAQPGSQAFPGGAFLCFGGLARSDSTKKAKRSAAPARSIITAMRAIRSNTASTSSLCTGTSTAVRAVGGAAPWAQA